MMEQFEKWKSENCESKFCPHEASCNGCENMWRAALKWALQIKITSDSCVYLGMLRDRIREELRGE